MSVLEGQVTHLEWATTPLWWIPLLPFVGAVTNAVFGRRLQASDAGRALSKRLHIGNSGISGVSAVAVGAMVCALALSLANFVQLATLDAGKRTLFSHAWQMVRIGSLDVNFSFTMDPLSGLVALIITGVGTLIHVYAGAYLEEDPGAFRFFSYLNLLASSMLLLVLGDNFIVMFFGWEGVGLCSYLLIAFWYRDDRESTAGVKAFVFDRIGSSGVICGVALLFWGLGGAWLAHGDYQPDYRARFVVADAEALTENDEARAGADKAEPGKAKGKGGDPISKKQRAGAKGYLTMTSHPGARIYLGVSDASQFTGKNPPELFDVSPFLRKALPVGVHNIAIVPGGGAVVSGDGLEMALLEHVEIERDEEKVILAVGPTVTLREIHDQLVLKDASGKQFLKEALQQRTVWGGVGLLTLSCLLFFLGAAVKSAQIPLFAWLPDAVAGSTPVSALIHSATLAMAGATLLARLDFLFSLSAGGIGLQLGLVALWVALVGERLRRAPPGRVRTYAYGILGGVVLLALLRYFLR